MNVDLEEKSISATTVVQSEVLLGDEAVAMGATDAGISACYGYPGTPSTEIIEFLERRYPDLIVSWCANEKTALEAALGVSMAGKRAMVTMKHVGLNVAADAFMNASILKIKGGLVLVVGDDPGMHASQNEQDSRFYADFAYVMCFEPKSAQQSYDMIQEAFVVSEKFAIPVILRIVTRLAHSRTLVKFKKKSINKYVNNPAQDRFDWINLPAPARKRFNELIASQPHLLNYSENSSYNKLTINPDFNNFGVITTGNACNYYEENLNELAGIPSHLHIGVYPMPINSIRKLASSVDKIIVLEDGYPFVERYLRGIVPTKLQIVGKMDGSIPPTGELTSNNVRKALELEEKFAVYKAKITIPARPPQPCAGCPHIETFNLIKLIVQENPKIIVTSDIGCYSLGALEPYAVLDSIVCMGASIAMARGYSEATSFPVIATIGDSTFFHSGIPSLIDAISCHANITVVILDNETTAMTGGQDTILSSSKLEKLLLGLGVDSNNVKKMVMLSKNKNENYQILKTEVEYRGVSVVIASRACVQKTMTSRQMGGSL